VSRDARPDRPAPTPLVANLADHAHTFIFERLAERKSKQSE
jgi:hypothetical protein